VKKQHFYSETQTEHNMQFPEVNWYWY